MRVQVYWNIHKQLWSVRDKKTGLVIRHLDSLVLDNCKLVVRQGGRERVLRERCKNIHAFVEGDLTAEDYCYGIFGTNPGEGEHITYNPYKHQTFVKYGDNEPVFTAPRVFLNAAYTGIPGIKKGDVVICDPAKGVLTSTNPRSTS